MKTIRITVLCILVSVWRVAAADIAFDIRGVDDPLKTNILTHVDSPFLRSTLRPTDQDFDHVLAVTVSKAEASLRPYGYYAAEVSGRARTNPQGQTIVQLNVTPGPPIIIETLQLEVVGEGASSRSLDRWRRNWPLREGAVLDQVVWEQQKRTALDLAAQRGHFGAKFTEKRLEIDLDRNRATVTLALDTGPRYVMGDIDFGEHVLKPGILEYVARFEKGDPYSQQLMDHFRSDLWQTGYFTDINVIETEVADAEPPRVDLTVRTETKHRNHYSGSVGFSTDTGVRLQTNWSRHPMSSNGDRLDLGVGWQNLDGQFVIRGTYRKPRLERNREYWTVGTVFRFESQDMEFKLDDEDEDFIKFANGNIDEQQIRFGRLKMRNLMGGEAYLSATPFVQYINSQRQFTQTIVPSPAQDEDELARLLQGTDSAISVGIEYGLVNVQGRGWDSHGSRERATMFHSNDAFGSDVEFTQLYVSSSRSFLLGDRWKFIARAEIGYTDAITDEFKIDLGIAELELSRTRLPNLYRFKAGGSNSVRGYGFEELSNNDIGSNHIITASAEFEFKVLENWSAAAFVDVGNAFNDWSEPELKTGIGVGVRWYSIAGPIRIDIAQALDFTDKPWRLHFTIGVPFL